MTLETKNAMNRAVFFDKDGVMNADRGVNGNLEPLELYPGISDLIAEFRGRGFKIFVVTNQPVVARGLMSEDELASFMKKFAALVARANPGALIDKIYYCPHHPNANVEKYRTVCECRKPKPGMLLRASREFDIDTGASFMIGDRMSDVIAGSLAGCATIHFLSGKHSEKAIETDLKFDGEIKPDHTITDLNELRSIIK